MSVIEKGMENSSTQWERRRFKNRKVWMATEADGRPCLRNGKVLIKYRLDQEYEYWVHEKHIGAIDSSMISDHPPSPGQEALRTSSGTSDPGGLALNPGEDAVVIFTDGASSGNPGPSGIGIFFRHQGREKEISRFIGITTNNVAELEAIRTALTELKTTRLAVRLFTDSTYARGVLTLGWKPKKNEALIRAIRARMAHFKDLKIIHVKGHEGDAGNERANQLAVSATKHRKR